MISNNFKKVGIFNLALILLVVIYDTIRLVTGNSIIGKITIIVHFIAYFFGLLYAFSGYKKDASKYYKLYMFLFSVSEIMSTISVVLRKEPSTISTLLTGLCAVFALILTFGKDLGKNTTLSICAICLSIHIYNLIHILINSQTKFQAITNSLSNIVLVVIALVFIIAKYENKALRGSK